MGLAPGPGATTRQDAPSALRFSFLGPVVVEPDDRAPVEVRGAQPALVLAYLVLERPRPLLRDELVELLWPGDLPAHWEGAARQVVSRVRRTLVAAGLPAESLTSEVGVTTLDVPHDVVVDVEVVLSQVEETEKLVSDGDWERASELADRALEAFRATFLPASECTYAADWRDRLDALARRALHLGAAAALGAERGERAGELASLALEQDPFDEHATRLLMAARAQSGNRPAALGAYERLRRLLDDELGVRPSEETEDLYRDLLGAPPLAPSSAAPPPRRPAATVDSGPFVGRHDELATLAEQWRRAHKGACQIVVLEGEAGIGKTRLLLEEAERAREAGASVLWGHCDPEIGTAHGPFADVVGQLVVDRPEVVERLGLVAGHLAPLAPQLLTASADATPVSSDQATAQLFRAVGAALASAADRPLLFVVDDLHWADGDTLALLRHVIPWLSDRPCLMVLAMREPTPSVAGALAELHRLAPTTTLALAGLSADDVGELLQASRLELRGEATAVAALVAARTAGNPLYVTQLVREAEGTGLPFDPAAVPSAVAQLLERRLASLDEGLSSVLVLSAVAGPEFDLAVVEACTTVSADELLDRVETLCHGHFLDEREPGRFAFAHELVRDAVLATVGATRRGRLHRRLAEALVAADSGPDEIAHHFVAAGSACADKATTWSLAAGNAALAGAAWSTARDHFVAAARLAPVPGQKCEALIGLGRAQRALSDNADARSTLDEALALARVHGLRRAVAAATLALVGGGGRGVALDLPDAERAVLLREALAGLDADDAGLLVPVLAELALALVLTDALDERAELCERCLAVARGWGDSAALATSLWARRIALMGPTGTDERLADGRETLALPRSEVPPELVLAAHLGVVEDLIELGDRSGADDALATATTLAAELDHPYWSWATACWRTLVAIIDGACDDAEHLAAAALEYQPGEHPEAVAAFGVNLVDVRLFQGRAGEVTELLGAAADASPQIPTYRAVLALCCAEAGNVDSARAAYDFFAARGFDIPADSNWLLAVAVLADTCATLDDAEGAARLTELLAPWAERQVVLNCYGGGGAYWGPVTHHLGRLAALRGDHAEARRLLGRAAAASDAFRAPLFAARSRAALNSLG